MDTCETRSTSVKNGRVIKFFGKEQKRETTYTCMQETRFSNTNPGKTDICRKISRNNSLIINAAFVRSNYGRI